MYLASNRDGENVEREKKTTKKVDKKTGMI